MNFVTSCWEEYARKGAPVTVPLPNPQEQWFAAAKKAAKLWDPAVRYAGVLDTFKNVDRGGPGAYAQSLSGVRLPRIIDPAMTQQRIARAVEMFKGYSFTHTHVDELKHWKGIDMSDDAKKVEDAPEDASDACNQLRSVLKRAGNMVDALESLDRAREQRHLGALRREMLEAEQRGVEQGAKDSLSKVNELRYERDKAEGSCKILSRELSTAGESLTRARAELHDVSMALRDTKAELQRDKTDLEGCNARQRDIIVTERGVHQRCLFELVELRGAVARLNRELSSLRGQGMSGQQAALMGLQNQQGFYPRGY